MARIVVRPDKNRASVAGKDRSMAGPLRRIAGRGAVQIGGGFRARRRVAGKILEGEGRVLVVGAPACKAGEGRNGEPDQPSHVGLHRCTRINRVFAAAVKRSRRAEGPDAAGVSLLDLYKIRRKKKVVEEAR